MRHLKCLNNLKDLFNLFLCVVVYVFSTTLSFADIDEEEALIELYGDEETISIATGNVQPISRAPAVATVITSSEIRTMGATDLDQILETVPGLHVSYRAQSNAPIYSLRGVFSNENPQVLVLVNGIPITNLFVGDRNQAWGGFPVESISRIEVIRGPGSAVYGADAFAGVINISTKQADEIEGFDFGSRLGRFDTRDVWGLYGNTWNGFDIALMAEFHETDGHREEIDSDAQTQSDIAAGTSASLAPGSVNTNAENFDIRADISRGNWQFRSGYQRRRDLGLGVGAGLALDSNGLLDSDRWNVDLTYQNSDYFKNWDINSQISYFNTSQEVSDDLLIFPPGAALFIPGVGFTPPFPNGVIGNPEVWEQHIRYNLSGLFSGFENHLIRVGTGYTYQEITKVKEENNFSPLNFGVLTDVSDTPFVFLPEKHRSNSFAFIQDIWNFSKDWELTAGLRYDDYNDFGDTWNPRLALVWAARHDLTAKLLYGQAFRAPSFAEFRNQNNPVALGNSELDPEEIQTLELAFDYRPKNDLRLGLNLFRYEWDNIIEFTPDPSGLSLTARNTGKQEGYGFEFEFDWDLSRTLNLLGNYAYQTSEDQDTNENSGNAPENQFYIRTNWEFLPDWHLTPQWNFVLDRKRPPGDPRDDIGDYNILDLTLRHTSFSGRWEVAVSGRNILDEHAFEPTSTSIPNDLPLAGRSFWGELRFHY